jgi:hypothetical protein
MHLHSITGTKDYVVERNNQSVSNFDDKASDNPCIPLGDNGSMNNTSDINDFISIDSDYEAIEGPFQIVLLIIM